MVVVSVIAIAVGIVTLPWGVVFIAMGVFGLSEGPKSARAMRDGGLEDGCMGNLLTLLVILMGLIVFSLAVAEDSTEDALMKVNSSLERANEQMDVWNEQADQWEPKR